MKNSVTFFPTKGWWRDLWLNEGFATFVGTQAVAHFFPEWELWTQFVSKYIMEALQADSLRSSHPVEVDVAVAREVFCGIFLRHFFRTHFLMCFWLTFFPLDR